jgi:BRCT domain type II-containing protein
MPTLKERLLMAKAEGDARITPAVIELIEEKAPEVVEQPKETPKKEKPKAEKKPAASTNSKKTKK